MMRGRAAIVAFVWLALAGAAHGQTLDTLPLSGSVESGADTVIAYGRHWNPAPCVPQRTSIVITQPPAHGTVQILEERADVPWTTPRTGGTGYCRGMLLFAKKIIYRSEPGFEGTDTLSYESIGPNGRRAPYTVTIAVTPSD